MSARMKRGTSSLSRATKRRKTTVRRQATLYGRTTIREVKSFDTGTIAAANLVAVGAVAGTEPAAAYTGLTEINCVPQGATVANRVGNKIVIKSIQATFELAAGSATATAGVRTMLLYDRQPNGAFPAIGDILLDQPANSGTAMSSINIANKSRFQMIRDQYFSMDPGQGEAKIVHMYAKGKWEVEYGSSAGTIADIKTGAIYFMLFYTRFGTAAPTIQGNHFRLRYYD